MAGNLEYPFSNADFLDVREYGNVLHEQQSYNVAEVNFLQYKVKDRKDKDAMLTDLLKQPVMASAYRAAGVKPEQVSEFIDDFMKSRPEKKDDLILRLFGYYGKAGDNRDDDPLRQISNDREWINLKLSLIKPTVTCYMKEFLTKKQQAELKPIEPKKVRFGKNFGKLTQWFEKNFKEIAVGVVSAVTVTAGGESLIAALDKIYDKKENNVEQVAKNVSKENQTAKNGKGTYQVKPRVSKRELG